LDSSAEYPAAIPVAGYLPERYAEKVDLVRLGKSITNSFEKTEYLPVWDFCHPSEKGCQAWADAIQPMVKVY